MEGSETYAPLPEIPIFHGGNFPAEWHSGVSQDSCETGSLPLRHDMHQQSVEEEQATSLLRSSEDDQTTIHSLGKRPKCENINFSNALPQLV